MPSKAAKPDNLPEADAVLVEAPHKLHELLPADPEAATAFRINTRTVFSHYLNEKRYEAVGLFLGKSGTGTKAFYLVKKV